MTSTFPRQRSHTWRRTVQTMMARRAREIAGRYYEPGNQARCYKRIWLRHALPELGINYRTFLNYVKSPLPPGLPPEAPPLPPLSPDDG